MTNLNWPSFFPPKCPPVAAKDASAEVFRLVCSNPPLVTDFQCWAQRHPKKWMGNCKASGLSVFTAKSDALRLLRRVPGMASPPGSFIASASLSPDAGKLMRTVGGDNSHHTWWAPVGFDHIAV